MANINRSSEMCTGPALPLNCLIERVATEPELKMIFRGITHQSCGVIFGPSKSLKTTAVETLGMHIAAGLPEFLGEPLMAPGRRVLFVSMEEFYKNRTKRNKKQIDYLTITHQLQPGWEENIFVVDEEFPRYMFTDAHWSSLEREIERVQPNVVMLDSMTRMTIDPIEDSTVASKVTRKLREIAYKYGIALLVIHHSQKIENRPLTLATLAGSRVIGQEMDFIIGINRTLGNVRYLKDVAYRYASDDAEKVLTFQANAGQLVEPIGYMYENELLTPGPINHKNSNKTQIMEYIKNSTQNDPSVLVETSLLHSHFVGTGQMTRTTLHNALNRLIDERNIKRVGLGAYTVPEAVNGNQPLKDLDTIDN
jgi:hypothetical protein